MRNKDIYYLLMSETPVKTFLSFDHTFKVAANIGYVRSDGEWVTLYNSVLIVMNEMGLIVASKLQHLHPLMRLHFF